MQGFISSVGSVDSGGQGGSVDTFVRLTVNLTGITPTTETVNNKQYNKFTFAKTNLTFTAISPFGDEETIAIDDALIYNLLPISNNNEDKGINITYDGTTFSGYVLAQESTLTTVSFMFTYYIILNQTSVSWKNYVDMVLSSGGGSGGSSFAIPAHTVIPTTKKTLAYVSIKNSLSRTNDYKYTYTDEDNSLFTLQSTGVSLYSLLNNYTGFNSNNTITLTNVYQYPVTYFDFYVRSVDSDRTFSFRVDLYRNESIVLTYQHDFTFTAGSSGEAIINTNNQVPYNTFYDKIVITNILGSTGGYFNLRAIGVAAQQTVACLDDIIYDENTFYHLYFSEAKQIYSINNKPAYVYMSAGTNKLYHLTKTNRNYLTFSQA